MIKQLEDAGAPQEVIDEAKRRAEPVDERFEVWPENWDGVALFAFLGTQWRIVSGMRTHWAGLDYNVMYHKMGRMNLSPERYTELEAEVCIMERAAKQVLNKQ